ncbi:MAG: ATP-binding protein [Verrucomicrobiota bacterium]|nr:ATP-binding protein [Verrucomicrobiota bacterium]
MPVKGDASKTMLIDIPPDVLRRMSTGKMLPIWKHRPIRGPAGIQSPHRKAAVVTVENADLQELFQGVYDAGLITNMAGSVMDANLRAVQFLRYSRLEFAELALTDIIIGFTQELIQTIRGNLQNDKFTLIMAHCLRKDGTNFPAEISSSRLKFSSRDYLCFFVRDITARREAENALLKAHEDLEKEVTERARTNEELVKEISERKRAEQELSRAVEVLQAHDRAKSQFVSNVSHELKTPVTSIMYVAGNLLRGVLGPIGPEARQHLEMIKEDCRRLSRTVEDILDMSRIEANTMTISPVNLPLADLVARAVESMKVQAAAEELRLTTSIVARERFVVCDPQKMERVIFNLVKNAIKFNVKNGTIEVVLNDDPRQSGFVTLNVIDSGIGIEPQHLSRVTERFFRVGEHVSGTGLGLAICKDLIERHGGTLEFQSPPPGRSKGTQATARLPVATPPTVMVIYDDRNVRLELIRQLAECGYNVAGSEIADSIADRIRKEGAELVALDWISAGMMGGIMIAKIRNEKDLSALPIVAVTGLALEPSKRDILDGFDIPRVAWPCNKRELQDRLFDAIVNKKRLERLKK